MAIAFAGEDIGVILVDVKFVNGGAEGRVSFFNRLDVRGNGNGNICEADPARGLWNK